MADPIRPVRLYNLEEFNERCSDLFDDNVVDFVTFAACGIDKQRDEQASVDLSPSRLSDNEEDDLVVSGDCDSLLGVHKDLLCQSEVTIFPIPKYEDSLKKNVHLYHIWDDAHGNSLRVPLHHIPNLGIGKWSGTNTLLRVLFLDLYGRGRQSYHVTKVEEVLFVEKGVIPALLELLDERATTVPLSHSAEMFRIRLSTGRLAFGSCILPEWLVPLFGDRLRRSLVVNGVEWGRNLVFLHQVRGVKNSTYHAAFDTIAAQDAIYKFFDDYHLDFNFICDISPPWYIDMGLEVSSKDNDCLAMDTTKHAMLVSAVLNLTEAEGKRLTKAPSARYYRDPAAHLTGAAGLRLSPPPTLRGSRFCLYMQVYLTDKSYTYSPESRSFGKAIKASDLLAGKGEKYISELYRLYGLASERHKSAVRIECRVHVGFARETFKNLDEHVLWDSLLWFPSKTFWGFKKWRTLAFKYPVGWQFDGPAELRKFEPALHVTAMAAWSLNGLHSTPDLGPSSRELLETTLPRIRRDQVDKDHLPYPIRIIEAEESEESGDSSDDSNDADRARIARGARTPSFHARAAANAEEGMVIDLESLARRDDLVPHVPFGVIFWKELKMGEDIPVPRFHDRGLYLSDPTFKFLFGKDRATVHLDITRSRIAHAANPDRLRNRINQPLRSSPPPENYVGFNLEAEGMSLNAPIRDGGSDIVDGFDEEEDRERNDMIGSLDHGLEVVWNHFLPNIINLCPNRRNARDSPYCLLKKEALDEVTIEVYQNLYLGELFDDVQWCRGSRKEWNQVFDLLWPAKGEKKTGKLQNYPKSVYYPLWEAMMERMEDDVAQKAREQIHNIYNTLDWVPYALCDRIWSTRPEPNGFRKNSGHPATAPAPRIIVRATPQWVCSSLIIV
ncbi:hypothetical protein FA15DRAFT_601072 [Coprinopsis marcescibilis]|uniref:Uncharacterized protein n=1 Tax=Coprinopsis marcescibilis TaxID=230819 RepID=A0A5C3KHL4_COPMA|nr:hypothetical protein FA15DRAFT_601072 [Coprinopsis marcescibilis]